MSDHLKEVAIAGLVVLELAAIHAGINGMLFSLVIAAIAAVAGYKLSDFVREHT